MTRGSRLMMLGLGILVSLAATPVCAQMVIGESRSSVDVNWSVLDALGPEPTLPSLITRKPEPDVRAVSTDRQAAPLRPVGRPSKVAVEKKTVPPVRAVAAKEAVKSPAAAPAAETVAAAAPPPKPPKPDIAVDVPSPAKAKPDASSAPPASAPTTKAEPGAVQFVKVPPPPAPPPVAAAPPPSPPAPPPVAAAPPPPPPAPPPVAAAPPPPPPAPPPVVAAAPPRQVVSSAPSSSAPSSSMVSRKGDGGLTVLFAADSDHLPEAAHADLERLAALMGKDETLNLQLLAYAAGEDASASKARRLSLTRALKVRTYLMELGVRSTRIEVRALGNKLEGGAPDRVDAVVATR